MQNKTARHGGLAWLFAVTCTVSAYGEEPIAVRSRVFDIDYAVQDEALPLESVELWYTPDDGRTWHQYGRDEDRRSPVSFDAPSEGGYGFYLVMANTAGASSGPPVAGTRPHVRAFIDFTPPVVQMHPPRQTTVLGSRVVQLRWTVIDAHLRDRPIELSYRLGSDGEWRRISGVLPNTGLYDWRIPDELTGSVVFKVTAVDRGGHRVDSESSMLAIATERAAALAADRSDAAVLQTSPRTSTPDAAVHRAQRLYEEGLTLREQGDFRHAIARLRQSARLNPSHTGAFLEMAKMLYSLGELDHALDAFNIVLEREPGRRAALHGAAKIHRRRNQLDRAAGLLRRILRDNPNDAETWMYLGDIAVYQGDELLARQWYTRAGKVDGTAPEIVAQTRKRLALMDEVSRTRD